LDRQHPNVAINRVRTRRHDADRDVKRPESVSGGLFFRPDERKPRRFELLQHQRPAGQRFHLQECVGIAAADTPPNFAVVYYLGYDPKGRLYLDGIDSGSAFLFASFNGTKFKSITLNHAIGGPGAVQAVGNDIVVGDQTNGANAAYRFAISGSTGKLVRTTPLTGAHDIVQFYILNKALVGGDFNPSGSTADRFNYPAGGTPTKTASGLSAPIGAVISQ